MVLYDNLIENNRRRIQLLEESARLLYQEWFVHLRFPGHEQVKIVDGVPDGWEIKSVRELLGKVLKKKKVKKEEYLSEDAVPCVDQSQNFIGGYIDDEEVAITENLPVVVFGDHTRIVKYIDFPFAQGADGTQLLVPSDDRIPRDFFYFMMSSINVANAFYARHFKFLKAKEVLLPDIKLMTEFSAIVSDSMSQIKLLRNQNRSLAQARDLLLPKLMSGELTV
ncbi:Type I restriction-modification system specificity subunit (fragment) [Methylotuvimicrobium alcaliphilum 20Z]|uniref:Type I restriction-modification system specificity subunit n=1 Tax=Methylotuvimicrobium alcaliphilum (strain DSM 19304 / NCIMB 14124 / VKM B-2133 / 20Z) TaxID=1091494 RepID=G4SWX9_META2